MKLRFKHSFRGRAFTLVEVMIASAIAGVASIGMFTVFLMVSRFAGEAFTETRIVNNASVAIEKISRDLTVAFRQDAVLAANRPAITNSNHTITYTVLLPNKTTQRRRLRLDSSADKLRQEWLNGATWTQVGGRVFLSNVEDFSVYNENTEGFISYVITINVDMGPIQGVKQYSMVGRSLPRNI